MCMRCSVILGAGRKNGCLLDQVQWCHLGRRCGSAEGLDAGRHCLKKWGFRRCEDICWIKSNAQAAHKVAARQDAFAVLQHTKVATF